jgi:hypothetical protein
MATTPQFGGTNGVAELDLGQPGGARYNVSARYTVQVVQQPERTAVVDQKLVQQNVAFMDNLGFELGRVLWTGTLKVNNNATLQAIVSDLNRAKHGSARVGGNFLPPSLQYIRPTVLKDFDGTTLCNQAVLEDWSFDGPRKRISGDALFTLLVGLRVVFKLLG